MDPRNPLDDRRDPRQCPQVSCKTVRRGSAPQGFVHLLPLRLIQAWAPTGTSGAADQTWPICPPCLVPPTHTLSADVKFSRDLSLRQATGGNKSRRSPATLLHGRNVPTFHTYSGHALSLPLSAPVVTLLCEVQ